MEVSQDIIREFFELHGFLVQQRRKYVAPNAREEEEIDFLVLNTQPMSPEPAEPRPFVLASSDLRRVECAAVAIRAWHTETFGANRLTNKPELFRFVEPAVFEAAARALGEDRRPLKILVIPALPQGEAAKAGSIAVLRSHGIDAVIPFRTALADLIAHVEPNRNYQKSELLQTLRILKNYDFFRSPQLELFRPRRARRSSPRGGES